MHNNANIRQSFPPSQIYTIYYFLMIFFAFDRLRKLDCVICIFSVLADFEVPRNGRPRLGMLDFLKIGEKFSPSVKSRKIIIFEWFFLLRRMMKSRLCHLYFQCPHRFRKVPKLTQKTGLFLHITPDCPPYATNFSPSVKSRQIIIFEWFFFT